MSIVGSTALNDKLQKERRLAEEADAKRRAEKHGFSYLDLISLRVPTEIEAMAVVLEAKAKEALLVPLKLTRKKLSLAVFDPTLKKTREVISELKKTYELQIYVSSLSGLKNSWRFYEYVEGHKEISGHVEINAERLKELAKSIKKFEDYASGIRSFVSPKISELLEIVLAGGLSLKASDIHLEPTETNGIIRIRVDGVLHDIEKNFPIDKYRAVVGRLKLLSGLKINIKEEAQDGRFTINLGSKNIEVRTSLIPSEYGETAVLRILDPDSLKNKLEDLGLRDDDFEILQNEIEKPNGLILNTGPTGSGKTTTLYAILKTLSSSEVKIITIEDPIEYHLEGISQTQVKPEASYTFESGLRSILRQDPDVILVGEIRDKETAEIALNASLTGHLVLSTLHTNDAVGAIPRLIDLGAKAQSIASGLNLVISQRLVRIPCEKCRKERNIPSDLRKNISEFLKSLPKRVKQERLEPRVYGVSGCEVCANTGYHGRTSIFELLKVTDEVKEKIYKNPSSVELSVLARHQEMVTMQQDGIIKMLLGQTTLEEVERVTGKIIWGK